MGKKAYDEIKVINALNRKREIEINRGSKIIRVTINCIDCGNKTWGKIDYLVHYCGYIQVWKEPTKVNIGNAGNPKAEGKHTKAKKAKSDAPRALNKALRKFKALKDAQL